MQKTNHSSLSRLLVAAGAAIALLGACGGGGGDSPDPVPPGGGGGSGGGGGQPPPAASTRWLTSAPNLELFGTADSGIDGALVSVNPDQPTAVARIAPNPVDSTVVRVLGGSVDATQAVLTQAGVRHVVWDEADGAGQITLRKLALDAAAGAAPAPQRLSSETALCNVGGVRFRLIGQSLSGDEAVFTYDAPSASGSCSADTRPRLVRLSMSASSAPIDLPTAANERVTPIAPIHGSTGAIAAFLAWRGDQFVRTDASLLNPVPLPTANVSGVVDAASAPLAPGFVTRFGIFVRSADGLRRYDKSTDRMSAPLVTGQVGQGTAIDQVSDDRAYYVSRADANGRIDMFRVDDLLVPAVQQINVEGALRPVGFRVLRSVVLYALEGRSDWRSWRKSDGVRSDVLDGENIALASTLHDQVFTLFANANGDAELAQGLPDGTQRRTFGAARLLGGSLADEVSPYARHLRRNAAYGHALIATPPGAGGNGELRWLGFGGASGDVLAGVFPQGLQVDADWQSPGIMGAQALVGIRKTGTSERYLFVARRAPASLTRAADGVQ